MISSACSPLVTRSDAMLCWKSHASFSFVPFPANASSQAAGSRQTASFGDRDDSRTNAAPPTSAMLSSSLVVSRRSAAAIVALEGGACSHRARYSATTASASEQQRPKKTVGKVWCSRAAYQLALS